MRSADDAKLNLREMLRRHPISDYVAGALCEAARVCLSRHHSPPKVMSVNVGEETIGHDFVWEPPDQVVLNTHANELDATRDGAYAVSLVCLERRLGLVAVSRAAQGTGADWLLAPAGETASDAGWLDLDAPDYLVRLEVSGQDRGALGNRARLKREQVRAGNSPLSGITAVVGFERAAVRIERVDEKG